MSSQARCSTGPIDDDPEETSISLFVPNVGSTEISSLIRDKAIYLSVNEVFNFLKIKNTVSDDLDSVSGFFIDPTQSYALIKSQNCIVYKNAITHLKPGDLLVMDQELYLKADWFKTVFQLDFVFNFRNLSILLNTTVDLPVVKELRLEEMRKNLAHLNGSAKPDTLIGRNYPVFHMGAVDWAVVNEKTWKSTEDFRANLGLGAVVAGGETDVLLYYHNLEKLSEKQQYYIWRSVNNMNPVVKQVYLGKVNPNSISSIYDPMIGATVTNAPTLFRRSFGSYPQSGYTEPNWTVELYVNGALVDYKKADASGFYIFQVPLVYGNTQIKLRFYGPNGEERSQELNVTVPFTFLPEKEVEYTATAGVLEDSKHSLYFHSNMNYGLNRRITVGGGFEYLSSVTSVNTMPYVNASLRLAPTLLLSGDYVYGVRSRGLLTYKMPSDLQFELDYTKYVPGQTAISYNYLEERKVIISMPLQWRIFSAFTRLTIDQIVLPTSKYTSSEWLLSVASGRISANISTYGVFINSARPYVYSTLSLAIRLPADFIFNPQAQYEYAQHDLISFSLDLQKRIFRHGYLDISYQENLKSNINTTTVGLRYDFSFAQTSTYVRKVNQVGAVLGEAANGSFLYDAKTNTHELTNYPNAGRAGFAILCFLDLNGNGKRDRNEPNAGLIRLQVNGGRIENSIKDSLVRILNLEPYTSYSIQLDPDSYDQVAWKLKKKVIEAAADPNQIKLIEIPVIVSAEVDGRVSLKLKDRTEGLGRIMMNFFNSQGNLAGRTMTETDGSFSFNGLAPGDYNAQIDVRQLEKLNLHTTPRSIPFSVHTKTEGDVVKGIQFILETSGGLKTGNTLPGGKTSGSTFQKAGAGTDMGAAQVSLTGLSVQTVAFGSFDKARAAQARLQKLLPFPVLLLLQGKYYKIRIAHVNSREEAVKIVLTLKKQGFYGIILGL